MKKFTLFALSAIVCFSLASCGSNDDTPNISFTSPNTTGHQLRSVVHAGYLPDTYDWEFTYNGTLLTGAKGTYVHETTGDYSYNVTLGFTSSTLTISSSASEKSTVTVGTNKLISQMKVNDNTYNFSYNDSGYLTDWQENIVNTGFGSVTSYNSKATIFYSNDNDIKQIIYTNNDGYPNDLCTVTFTAADTLNVNGLLPEALSKQMGILGFEYLYYLGALGKPTKHLVRSVHVAYNTNPALDYDINFHYVLNNNKDITFCSYAYKEQSASATYKY